MKVFLGAGASCGVDYLRNLIKVELFYNGYEFVDVTEEADVIIFPNSCVGAMVAIEGTIKYIDSIIKRKKSGAKTYLTGCITRCSTNIEENPNAEAREYFKRVKEWLEYNIDVIVPEREINDLFKFLLPDEESYNRPSVFGAVFGNYMRSRTAKIFLSKGCLNKCSFCKSTYQNFQLISAPFDDVKAAIDQINMAGIDHQVDLIGSNITEYGIDLCGECKLPELIEYIELQDNIKNLELHGFAFKDAINNKRIRETIRYSKKVTLLDGGLESGSNRILSLMKKGFTVEELLEFVTYIRSDRQVELFFNIISGFPTETEEDIRLTLELLKELRPCMVAVCRYCDSPFVASHQLPQLTREVFNNHAMIYSRELSESKITHQIV